MIFLLLFSATMSILHTHRLCNMDFYGAVMVS